MKKKRHARLAPSASDRWLACPPSVAASENVRSYSNAAADEGTLAHNVLEATMLTGIDPLELERYGGEDVPEDMRRCVAHAVNYVHRWQAAHPDGRVYTEQRLDPGQLIGREDCFGTSDIIMVDCAPETRSLEILDYKHGRKPVPAKENTQLKLYAVGALLEFFTNRDQKAVSVKLVIVQPRVQTDFHPEWDTTGAELIEWMKLVVAKATKASDNGPDGKRTAGDHCRWCPASGTCRELASEVFRVAAMEFKPQEDGPDTQQPVPPAELDAEEVYYALTYASLIEGFLDGIYKSAQRLLLDGHDMPGWKLVYRRNRYKYVDDGKVVAWLEKNKVPLDEAAPRSPLSRTAMKRLLSRYKIPEAKLASFEKLVIPPEREVAVAPFGDNRKTVEPEDYGEFLENDND